MNDEETVIEVVGVQKIYSGVSVEKQVGVGVEEGVSLCVRRNEVFGIIGPDGAGKTTLFRLMTSLLKPDAGTIHLLGYNTRTDYKEIRKLVGYMPGVFSLYPDLTVEGNLRFFASLFGVEVRQNYDLIRDIYVQIEPFRHRKAKNLSGGMKQKLALSCALIHKPEILFLDEPTTGIDPVSRVDLWNLLGNLSQNGVTVVVSTAYMDEAKRCDRVAFMIDSKILAINTPSSFEQTYPFKLLSIKGKDPLTLLRRLRRYKGVMNCYSFGDTLHASLSETVSKTQIENFLLENGLSAELSFIPPTIEDAFIHLSGIELK